MKTKEVTLQIGESEEVENPLARFFLAIFLSFAGLTIVVLLVITSVTVTVAAVILTIVFSPLLVPLHYLLRACGRQGFSRSTKNKLTIKISTQAFRKFGSQSS